MSFEAGSQDGYAYAFGRIMALGNRLIPKARMEELARARSVQEVLAHLEETEYTHYLSQANGIEEFERELDGAVERGLSLCLGMVPESWVVDIFSTRKDFELFKEAMRKKGPLPEDVAKLVEGKSTLEADLALDREMFSRILGMVRDDGIKDLIKREIDLLNIIALARGGKGNWFVEGGFLPQEGLENQKDYAFLLDEGTLAEKGRMRREFLVAESKRMVVERMDSPAVVFAFLLEKEGEVLALSAIIKSKLLGLEAVPA